MERVRRGKFVSFIVGEVWPASAAARAGVTPGSLVGSGQWGEGRFKAALIQLTPDQTHLFENTGSVQFSGHALQTIEFQYPCGAPDEPFETRRLPSGALYIRFDAFEAPILNRVEAALKTAGDHGVVLDLRHNPGGYVDQALDFLLPGSIPTYIYLDSYGKHPIYTEKSTWRYGGPLVVLVGPASASAAEITAAVLKHEHRAVIIGRRTNGSVLGSIAFPLPDGGKVQVPVSDVEMLDGQRLEDVGVAPDIEVFPGLADLRAGIDPALVRAERELASGGVKRR
jgi:carboxyl-terminal processing protease